MNVHITCSRPKTVCWDINLFVNMFFGAINATDGHVVQGKDKVFAHSVICVKTVALACVSIS